MTYGVKAIHIISIGNADQRLYEEIILRVEANSYDEAYSKAAAHLMNSVLDHTNPEGQQVRTVQITAIDCFLAPDPEGDVQEVFSSIFSNTTPLSDADFRNLLLSGCSE